MKAKFTTLDIKLIIIELKKKLLGMRVNNVYDIDSKTYLIKLHKTDGKAVLLLESGIRFHTTEFEWPKNIIPSGFAMKLRKHLKGRRLESIQQLGVDRIVDFQFGSGEAAYHVILEVYDRGNIVLTDYEYNILNIQRPRTDNDKDVKFIVREKYPIHLAKQQQPSPTLDDMATFLGSAAKGDNLRKVLNPHLIYGSHLLDHCLFEVGLKGSAKIGTDFKIERDMDKLMEALNLADEFMKHCDEKVEQGYIINQKDKNISDKDQDDVVLTYSEFHPFLFKQHSNEPYNEFESFDKAVDEFFSKIESQKQDRKILQQKSTAMKKLEHIKLDNQNRISGLQDEQLSDMKRAWLIELNLDLVDEVIAMMRNALAHQLDWSELKAMVEEASGTSEIVGAIKSLKLDINHVTLLLKPPENMADVEDFDLSPMKIDIDLGLSAYSNARKYYDMKRHAAVKENKTSDALQKAYKSVEKKTLQVLKEVQTVATINKARKTHWFEKFLWFISSENYVVVGGRDQQQNELIVKRYLKPGDIYVHADLHGASSIVIKNPTKKPVPPVTLDEAGAMALCNSAAWDARVVTSSWWVYHDQVSKTAPTGEYLTTGSFMIRGKKNYLLPASLIYGFGFLFKLDESCLEKHKNERRIKGINGDDNDDPNEQHEEVVLEDDNKDDDDGDDDADNDSSNSNKQESTANGNQDDENTGTSPANGDDDDEEEEDEKEEELGGNDNDEEKNGSQNDAKDSEDEFDFFPDTQIKIINLNPPSSNPAESIQEDEMEGKKNVRMTAKQRRDAKKQGSGNKEVKEEGKGEKGSKSQPLTKGQKSKMKKIKKKYGDQDEEEREMRMQLLAPDRPPNENTVKRLKRRTKGQEKDKLHMNQKNKKQEVKKKVELDAIKTNPNEIVIDPNQPDAVVIDDEMDDETDNKQIQQELELLDSLTGIPLPDDVLHYCVPVCAPWNALKNYRFKVKLTPGTSKRGKASKMAIGMFMQDKTTTSLEKDLFRSVKDADLSRNMPGKVKVSITKTQHKK